MTEIDRITDQLRRAFDGDAWSGPSLLATLAGLTAAQAQARPLPAAHSIWQLVLHLRTWLATGQYRLMEDFLLQVSDEEDWPALPAVPDEAAWQRAQDELRQAHEQLLATVAGLRDTDLDQRIGAMRNPAQGLGVSRYVLLHGLAQHNLYHAGQIALLRKAFS